MRKPSVLVIFLTVFIDLIGFGIVVPLVPVYSSHFSPVVIKLETAASIPDSSPMSGYTVARPGGAPSYLNG